MSPIADSASLCTTPACVHIASEILSSLDPNYAKIDPCTDFDQYACGNWASQNPTPEGQPYTNTLTVVHDRTYDIVARDILEGPYPAGSDADWITVDLTDDQATADKENFDKLQTAYATCMNYTAHEEEGLENLKRLVKLVVDAFPSEASDGGYEELEEPQDYSAAMGNTLTLLETVGIRSIQSLVVKPNTLDPDELHVLILPGDQSLPATTEETLIEYAAIAVELLSAVHPAKFSTEKSTALVQAMAVLQGTMAESLAATLAEEAEALEKADKTQIEQTTPNTSLADIQRALPLLNYDYVVRQLSPKGYVADKVALPGLSYYKNISDTISRTPAEVVQTYFVWKSIVALAPYVESKETNALVDFTSRQQGNDPGSPPRRERKCAGFVDAGVSWVTGGDAASFIGSTGLTWILSRFFVEKTFSPKAKDLTADLVHGLKDAFIERLEKKDWVSKEVKKAATKKVKDMAEVISLPLYPEVLDPIAIKEYYADAEITSSHFANALSLAKVNVAQKWAQLGKPFKRGQFLSSTLESNAFHEQQSNLIVLLTGIQQFPLFDIDFPSYILFGGMGSVVGHEITHGFDDTGRRFDSTGNMTTWWDEGTIENFNKKTECFVDQYDKFTVTAPDGSEVAMSGQKTLGENIADAGGVTSSFTAWQNWEGKKGKSKNLPGLDEFTHEQLFFLRWGQTWCSNTPPAAAIVKLGDDNHSPEAARIKLTLENSEGFKKAFKCPEKKPMCELW